MPKIKTLFIMFYFPPFSRVGGRRWAKHIKYMQRFGEEFHVLAGAYDGSSPWDQDIKTYEAKITRIPVSVYYPYYKRVLPKNVFQKLVWKVSIKHNHILERKYIGNFWDDSRGQENKFYKKACEIIKEKNISHVCLSVGPFSYATILPELKKEFKNLKITLDYRDYWYDGLNSISAEGKKEELKKQMQVLNVVDLVLAPNNEMCAFFKNEFNKNVYLLPHCIDEDFQNLESLVESKKKDQGLVFIYGGSLYGNMEKYISQFIDLLKMIEKLDCKVKLKIFTMQPSYVNLFEKNNIQVEIKPLLQIKEFIEIAQKSDIVLLFRPDWSPNGFSTKFFEGVALRKPVLYIGPDGEVNQFIKNNELGFSMAENSVEVLANLLIKNAETNNIPNKKFSLSENTFDFQTKKLINLWNKTLTIENN